MAEKLADTKEAKSSAGGSADGNQDGFTEGILQMFRPAVEELDNKALSVRKSQVELREQIDKLAQELHRLSELQEFPVDLEPYVKKLMNSRRRVMLVNNIVQNAQERLGRLHQSVTRETAKRKALLEPSEFS
ncbi:SNARE-associated protein Snapin-like [Stylophora pistillata]|uniref:Biogenesis of lysosome-related organelles complex 1 subunit 7 n=1 Tax=Stylophora pistillata TaxID=50429 RepID=A0A2B4RQ81_STYPI|nr:SNARE-associated protein Snapin-like [Stylophora pistillata]XP_022801849.1 SNARE-associated protein Snapin-like [Stylophora pistillata]PFX18497.1 SNARE-associated protein Snapin [Stylophora pistillata]